MNVLDVVFRREELVEVVDGSLELVRQQGFPLLALLLLDQVQADDGRAIAMQARQEVQSSGCGKGRGSVNWR